MKQVEKLDTILRYLYDRRFDGHRYMLFNIPKELELSIGGRDEVIELGQRLKKDGVIDAIGLAMGDMAMQINSYGVEYCEGRSYGNIMQPLASSPINISGSQQVVVVSHSPGTSVLNMGSGAMLADRIMQEAGKDESLSDGDRATLKQLLEEINACAAHGVKPQLNVDTLIGRFGNLSSVGSLITTFAQMAMG
ncbi:MAG: hypothetical protein IPK99_03920 [Flavobacteriales bacterium]|nr:hypothetical protein [Flavobacteriales bacterium]